MARTLFVLLTLLVTTGFVVTRCDPVFGARPTGARQSRIETSPQWQGDRFRNPARMWSNLSLLNATGQQRAESAPKGPVPYAHDTTQRLAAPLQTGLRITWFGHSWTLVEIDGARVLIDPIESLRASPFQFLGPKRWFPPPIPLSSLANVDAVVISHDHYDHLDMGSIQTLARGSTRFVVPLGVGAHLTQWGVPDARITELDWWESTRIGTLTLTSTPARHASGRVNPQRNRTLWSGYALQGARHRVWYSGDTGMTAQFEEVGRRLGPFDVTLIEAGQYDARWPDWHIGPEQAVQAHRAVRGRWMIPIHWGLFELAPHGWTEPVERILAAARCAGVQAATPLPGRPFEPGTDSTTRWWPRLPWSPATETPIVASLDGDPANHYPILRCRGTVPADIELAESEQTAAHPKL